MSGTFLNILQRGVVLAAIGTTLYYGSIVAVGSTQVMDAARARKVEILGCVNNTRADNCRLPRPPPKPPPHHQESRSSESIAFRCHLLVRQTWCVYLQQHSQSEKQWLRHQGTIRTVCGVWWRSTTCVHESMFPAHERCRYHAGAGVLHRAAGGRDGILPRGWLLCLTRCGCLGRSLPRH